MHESGIEGRLRRYRPVGPPPDLSARIFDEPAGRAWPWAVAAAALLAMTLGLHAATSRLAGRQALAVAEVGPTVDDIAAALGGGEEGRRMAELSLLERRARAELMPSSPPATSMPFGEMQ